MKPGQRHAVDMGVRVTLCLGIPILLLPPLWALSQLIVGLVAKLTT